MLDRLANRFGIRVTAGVSGSLRRFAPVALGAVLFAAIGLAWPLRGSPTPLGSASSPAIPPDVSAADRELDDFLAMARWGRPAYDADKARREAEARRLAAEAAAAAGGINPELVKLGVIGISTAADSRAVLLDETRWRRRAPDRRRDAARRSRPGLGVSKRRCPGRCPGCKGGIALVPAVWRGRDPRANPRTRTAFPDGSREPFGISGGLNTTFAAQQGRACPMEMEDSMTDTLADRRWLPAACIPGPRRGHLVAVSILTGLALAGCSSLRVPPLPEPLRAPAPVEETETMDLPGESGQDRTAPTVTPAPGRARGPAHRRRHRGSLRRGSER